MILVINLFVVIISTVITLYVINMVYENSCRELKELYFKFAAENSAEKIETSVNLGMDIDNYYGMYNILSETVSYDRENMDAVFINTSGNPTVYTFEDSVEENLAYMFSFDFTNALKGEEEIISMGNKRLLAEPINTEKGCAYIVIMYDKSIFSQKDSFNIISEYIKNVDSISNYIFENIKSSIYDLHRKGLEGRDIEKMSDFYNDKFSEFGLVKSVEIGYGYGNNGKYSLEDVIFEDSMGEFKLTININNEYIKNIYIQTILTFAASLAVCIMIIAEISSLNKIAGNFSANEASKSFKGNVSGIIKFFTFFSYLAVYAVLPYGAVIIRRGGESIPGLPLSLTASLPVSLNCMGIFIMLLVGEKILKKIRINTYIFITVLTGIISMGICLLKMNVYFILISSFLMGVCLGMGKYVMNYLVSVCSDTDGEIKLNYGYYNAGLLAGLTLGGSVGGIISSAKGYEYVYIAGGIIMLVMLPIMLYCVPYNFIRERQIKYKFANEDKTKSFWGFINELFKRPKLVLDFIMTSVPLNMGLMFIVSFLPILLDIEEMPSLVNTFSYIIYGIAGNYMGIYIIKRLKDKKENISGFISMSIITLSVFVLVPKICLITILISAFLAGLFDGYGGACLTLIPVNSKNAEGIDKSTLLTGASAISSIVCIFCPMIYSVILSIGSIGVNLILIFLFFAVSGIYILKSKNL